LQLDHQPVEAAPSSRLEPMRVMAPPAPMYWKQSEITWPTPVHSMMMSGSKPRSAIAPEW